jgi:succinate-acetate transporter protein
VASGLFSFASTTLLLSFVNVQTRGVTEPNVVVGMALFVGGLAQLLAGMWEFPRGNVFGATGGYMFLYPWAFGSLPWSFVPSYCLHSPLRVFLHFGSEPSFVIGFSIDP